MDLTFTAIKNPGAASFNLIDSEYVILHRFLFELTNQGSRDLDDFREILKIFPSKKPGILQIDIFVSGNNTYFKGDNNKLYINSKPIEPNIYNVHALSKISNLMSKISEMPTEKLTTLPKYAANKNFFSDAFNMFSNERKIVKRGPVDEIHNPINIKHCALRFAAELKRIAISFVASPN